MKLRSAAQKTDVIIIGGGILGVSLAHHLTARRTPVVLIEGEESPACHASGKNTGMFRHLYREDILTEWAHESLTILPIGLKEKFFSRTGSIIAGRARPMHHPGLFHELEVQVPEERGGEVVEHALPAVLCKADGLIRSSELVRGLFELCGDTLLQAHLGTRVVEIVREGANWTAKCSSGAIFAAPWLVLAPGSWYGREPFDIGIGKMHLAVPYARHLFEISGFDNSFILDKECGYFWNEEHNWYIRKWSEGARLFSICDTQPADLGSFRSPEDLELKVRTVLNQFLGGRARRFEILRSWHCFRSYTDDQLPIYGEDPIEKGVFWLGAFGGYGMSTGYAAARDAARYISGEGVKLPPHFAPGRRTVTSRRE